MKRHAKKKSTVDIPNQSKITSFFKKSDSNGGCNANASTSLSNISITKPGKKDFPKTTPAAIVKKKEVEVIVISESSSDSDVFQTKETKPKSILECQPPVTATVNGDEQISKHPVSEKDDKCHPQAIRIVNLKNISEVETQVIDLDEPTNTSQFPAISTALNNVLTPIKQEIFSNNIDGNADMKFPKSIFENPELDFDFDSRSCLSPSLLYQFENSPQRNFENAQELDKVFDGQKTPEPKRKAIGLFLSPDRISSNTRTPTKSPKSIATYFSPVRHLRSPQRNLPNKDPLRNNNYSSDPYYYKNFVKIVCSVSCDQHYSHLFNEDDTKITQTFHGLSKQAQCLYVRLFQRKWTFKPVSSIKYPLISENLAPYFEELAETGFLEGLSDEKRDLDLILDLLNGDQMSLLSKNMGVSGKTKENCKASLIKMSQTQKTLFSSSSEIIYKEAIKLLGPTYKISVEPKNLFSRYFILHSPPQYWEDQSDQSSNQLLSILLMDMGKMEYPECKINRTTQVYFSRVDLIRFQDAWALHSDLNAHAESKNWEDVRRIGEKCLELLEEQLSDLQDSIFNSKLPTFLRVYTAASVLAHTVWLSVQGLQKLKNFSRANEVINILLSQSLYLEHYRGRWFERIIVNMKHLKASTTDLMNAIKAGLTDAHAQNTHKYTLSIRYEKLAEEQKRKLSKVVKKGKKDKEPEEDERILTNASPPSLYHLHHEIPTRTIEGEKFDMFSGGDSGKGPSGFKSVFLGLKSASSVEQFAMNYYAGEGYNFGVHGEGSVPVSIFGLLFWDIIYNDEIQDVFQSVFQPFPLDINFEGFYYRRKCLIDEKLNKIRNTWSMDETLECLERHWNSNFSKICLVNWTLFTSVKDLQTLVRSMGIQVTASICERMAKNFRHHRSGFPDLVMWDGSKCIIVEVKGPGDSLSAKQSLWIDFLLTIGASVEVCNVKSVSNKRLRTK